MLTHSTGKTTFIFDVLLDRLERRLPTAIQVTKHRFVFFDEDGPRLYDGTQEAPRLSEDCWALIDDVESPCTAILISRAHIVCALPPNRWPGWAKQKAALTVFTELPRLVEIAAIACVCPQDPGPCAYRPSHVQEGTLFGCHAGRRNRPQMGTVHPDRPGNPANGQGLRAFALPAYEGGGSDDMREPSGDSGGPASRDNE